MAPRHLAAVPNPNARHPDDFDPEEYAAVIKWLESAPDAFLACRGNHNFPKLVLKNGRLPKGISAEPTGVGGIALITAVCPDCKSKRMYYTAPGGFLFDGDKGLDYDYDWPDGYRMPKGARKYISSRDCKNEEWRRIREALGFQ